MSSGLQVPPAQGSASFVPEHPEHDPVRTLSSKTSQQRRAKREHQKSMTKLGEGQLGRARGGGRPVEGEEEDMSVWPQSALSWAANRKGSRPGSGRSRVVLWKQARPCGGWSEVPQQGASQGDSRAKKPRTPGTVPVGGCKDGLFQRPGPLLYMAAERGQDDAEKVSEVLWQLVTDWGGAWVGNSKGRPGPREKMASSARGVLRTDSLGVGHSWLGTCFSLQGGLRECWNPRLTWATVRIANSPPCS